MLAVVGVGIAKGHLTERGRKLMEKADLIYGSKRAIELVKEHIKCEVVVMKKFCKEVYEEIEREGAKRNVVVLSTGDPMVSGLGLKLRADVIESGISSVQVALARLGLNLCDVIVIDCHARDEDCIKEIEFIRDISIKFDIKKFAKQVLVLAARGFKIKPKEIQAKKVIVLENLCRENEKIFELNTDFVVSSDSILYIDFS